MNSQVIIGSCEDRLNLHRDQLELAWGAKGQQHRSGYGTLAAWGDHKSSLEAAPQIGAFKALSVISRAQASSTWSGLEGALTWPRTQSSPEAQLDSRRPVQLS